MGVEGARRLHVGHIHMLRGKIRPQRDLSPKSPPSQRGGGCTTVSGPTRKVGYLGDKDAPEAPKFPPRVQYEQYATVDHLMTPTSPR